MASGENFGSEKLTLRNKLKNSSLLFARVSRSHKLFLAQYLYQKKISKGGCRPIMHYIAWLLVLLQGQKEAVTERGLEFFNN